MSFNTSFIFDAIDKLTPVTQKIAKSFEKLGDSVKKINKASDSFNSKLQRLSQSSKLANNSIVRLAAGYFSLRTAINFGKDLIQAQVQLQNINAALKSVTGSQAKATAEFQFVRKAADEIGISFDAIMKPYTRYLAASRDSVVVNRKVFSSFSKLARVQGLTAEKTKSVFIALGQIQSKGKLAAQELRTQLGDALPDAFNLFVEASGKSKEEFNKLLDTGRIGAGIIARVAELIEKKLGKSSVEASKTLGAEIARLQNAFGDLKRELSTGIFSRTVATSVIFLTNNLKVLSQVILSIGAFVAIANFPAFGGAIIALGAKFLLILNPITAVVGAFALLFINWKRFRDDFFVVADFMIDKFNKLKNFGKDLFGKNKFEQEISRTGGFTTNNNVGFKGTLDINNAPVGSKATLSPFGSINPNVGLNMSFAPNGGI